MSTEVLHQIQYLCRHIAKVEWSGALFYTVEGSIKDPKTFKIILKTILPLDMGSAAYTEYNLDDRFLDFIEEDFEERCTWKLGHIHSHNTMAVFFSGTDMAELNDNAPSHNFYLSLIVNNFMDFMAKVAFTAGAKKDIKQVPFFALDEEGQQYTIEKTDFVVDTDKLFVYNCDIQTPLDQVSVTEVFSAQVAKIMEPKPVKPVVARPPYGKPEVPTVGQGWRKQIAPGTPPRQFPQQKREEKSFKKDEKIRDQFEDWGTPANSKPFSLFDGIEDLEEELNEDLDEQALRYMTIDKMAKDLFSFSHAETEDMDLDEVLDALQDFQLTPFELAKIVIDSYAKVFDKHFFKATSEDFIQYTHELLDLLEDQTGFYPEIKPSIKVLTDMINKFITHETNKHNSTSKV